jgi:methylmalonyl-CoA/ethylmalonyl-CoA epimerase
MITKIDHIGIAVRDLEVSKTYYRDALGLKLCGEETVDSQQVKTAFFEAGEVHIELLEATAPTSPIAKYIEKNGEGVHHVAFYTDSIESELQEISGKGIRLIHEQPIEGAGGKSVAFLHPKSTQGVLTELCSKKTGPNTGH